MWIFGTSLLFLCKILVLFCFLFSLQTPDLKFYSSPDSQTLNMFLLPLRLLNSARIPLVCAILGNRFWASKLHCAYTTLPASLSNGLQTWTLLCPRPEKLLFHVTHLILLCLLWLSPNKHFSMTTGTSCYEVVKEKHQSFSAYLVPMIHAFVCAMLSFTGLCYI